MRTVITQGGGFYGCGLWTTDATFEQIADALQAIGAAEIRHTKAGRVVLPHVEYDAEEGITAALDMPGLDIPVLPGQVPETFFNVFERDGVSAPEPMVLFCTGNSKADLHGLQLLKQQLSKGA